MTKIVHKTLPGGGGLDGWWGSGSEEGLGVLGVRGSRGSRCGRGSGV